MKPMTNKFGRYLKYVALIIMAFVITYLCLAILGALLPANSSWTNPLDSHLNDPIAIDADNIDIFVETNGIHVNIILPLTNDEGILRNILYPYHLQKAQYNSQFAMIGWGHKGVYQNAQDWNDLTIDDAFSAASGAGDALLHIYYIHNPKPNNYRKKIRITRAQYLNILNNISSYFKYDENGKLRIFKGYGDNDLFYEAHGRYSIINTCNVWMGMILREAGIKVGYWTPFSQSIMWRY